MPNSVYPIPRSAPTGGRSPRLGAGARRPLQRPILLFDVLANHAQGGAPPQDTMQ